MPIGTLEERVTALERELTQLKNQLQTYKTEETIPWWEQISGVFKDCPEFEEAVRLGREWRESQQMEYEDDTPKTLEETHASA